MYRRRSTLKDPTVRVKLYSWSTEEFREEHALIYISRSNPSHTCISHWRANRDKVLFTLQDCLCVDNPIKTELEIKVERGHRGFFVMNKFEARNPSGKLMERREEPGLYQTRYQDIFRHREAELKYTKLARDEAEIEFFTGFTGGPGVIYYIKILCHPLKGIDVDLDGPHCDEGDFYSRRLIALCSVEYVGGMPPSDVLEQANFKLCSGESKEEKKNNNTIDRTTLPSSTIESSVIVNAGQTQGTFNGATFTECKFVLGRLAKAVKGLTMKDLQNST